MCREARLHTNLWIGIPVEKNKLAAACGRLEDGQANRIISGELPRQPFQQLRGFGSVDDLMIYSTGMPSSRKRE